LKVCFLLDRLLSIIVRYIFVNRRTTYSFYQNNKVPELGTSQKQRVSESVSFEEAASAALGSFTIVVTPFTLAEYQMRSSGSVTTLTAPSHIAKNTSNPKKL
jgi:hypothetical protein